MATPPVDMLAAERKVSAPSAEAKEPSAAQKFQSLHYKLVLTVYRVFAIIVLYLGARSGTTLRSTRLL